MDNADSEHDTTHETSEYQRKVWLHKHFKNRVILGKMSHLRFQPPSSSEFNTE